MTLSYLPPLLPKYYSKKGKSLEAEITCHFIFFSNHGIMMTICRGEKPGNFKGCDSYYGLGIHIDAWIYIMVKLIECTTRQNYDRIYCSATFK